MEDKNYRAFKDELRLDRHDLDTAALEQPERYAHWALLWADAVDARDRKKDQLALVKSECDFEVRSNPKDWGWTSDKAPTEAFISSTVASHEKMVAATEEYYQYVKDVNILTIAKEAFETRRRMIAVLVDLYKSDYFSGNKAFDKSYQEVRDKEVVKEQTAALEQNSRLTARRKIHDDADTRG